MNKIAIIDMDSILFSAFIGNKVIDENTAELMKIDGKYVYEDKTDDEIKETLDGIMHHIFNEGSFTHYITLIKGKDTIKDRLAINPDYKQQRTKETPEKWEFTKQYAIEKWNAIEVNNIEVDDAVRICNINIENSHIVAIDKDLLWLKGTNFNWRKNEWITVTEQEEEEYLAVSMVCGDTVDNIPGLYMKGKAYCTKNNIKTLGDAFTAYLNHYISDPMLAVEEYNKNFKCLYILKKSIYFKNIPIPIKIEIQNETLREYKSRSSSPSINV